MIDHEFPEPKDPQDFSWYAARSSQLLDSIQSVVATATTRVDTTGIGNFNTPGDSSPPSDLVISDVQVNMGPVKLTDGTVIPTGFAIVFRLAGGTSGISYAVTITYTTAAGDQLVRSGILVVTGR